MALLRRTPRPARHMGMSPFVAGAIALALIAAGSWFGFTKANPFASPYRMSALFETANNLKPRSPVRIAGIDVGEVKKVEPLAGGDARAGADGPAGPVRVEMEISDRGLPIHEDAQLKVRQRIFLEGNFFVDLEPGSPAAPQLEDGSTLPATQTAAPVQFGQLLAALQSDVRDDLQVFLKEYSRSLEGKGARGFNESIRYWKEAYRSSALAAEATLGERPARDIQRVLRGQQRTFRGLAADEDALKGLVTSFNVTAAALAREDDALEASVPELSATLRVARPALRSLNDALPSLRAFARDALPGVRSSGPALEAAVPFVRQARLLVRPDELRGAAAELRRYVPSFVRLNETSVGLLEESRQLSACTNKVLVPFTQLRIPDPDMAPHGNSDQRVREQIQRSFPSLAAESRLSDGINQFFHASAVPPGERVRPVPPPDGGSTPPPHRPDVPCETQELPDLAAPGAPISQVTSASGIGGASASAGASAASPARKVSRAEFRGAVLRAKREWPAVERTIEAGQRRNLEYFKRLAERAGEGGEEGEGEAGRSTRESGGSEEGSR